MWLKWNKNLLLGLILLSVLLLAGCAAGTAHLTVQKNGSIDLAVNLQLNARAGSLLGGKVEELLTDKLQESGITLNKQHDGKAIEYQFVKSYASFEDMKANAGNLDIVDAQVDTDVNWFYTKYDIEALPKLNAYAEQIIESAGSLSVPESLVRMVIKQLAFDFKLTLPYNVYGANNAAEQDGNTLTWHITLADTDPIRMEIYVPNIKNIIIGASVIVLAVAAAVVLLLRKKKAAKPPEPPKPRKRP